MKILIKYSDWLLKERGEIRPEIGDVVKLSIHDSFREREIKEIFKTGFNIQLQFSNDRYDWEYLNKCYVEIDSNFKPNLEGLLKDGYTFICPEHGLHPNCDCQDNQIKVWNDNAINPNEVIEFIEWLYINDWDLCATNHCSQNGNVEETAILYKQFKSLE